MSILPDSHIKEMATLGSCCWPDGEWRKLIEPYDENRVQPASYDVALGSQFRVFPLSGIHIVDLNDPKSFEDLTEEHNVAPDDPEGFVLHPGELVLATTIEKVQIPDNMVARIEGKSSLGRIGLTAHITAGFIDPGFIGTVTLEMANLMRDKPIVMHPGNVIAQLSFQWLDGRAQKPYAGRYQGDEGVAPSRYGQELPPMGAAFDGGAGGVVAAERLAESPVVNHRSHSVAGDDPDFPAM